MMRVRVKPVTGNTQERTGKRLLKYDLTIIFLDLGIRKRGESWLHVNCLV